ncbi:gliding motility-associated ABC transporter ATP-binding subunit GldA [Polaribacter sp. HL-MS24]|uniref:gliding motility-associated ABC transporter ATP-binding subunit GldA n=1 Tax=Polaribacter sp. HL-MS24 TaxID=3077735 RepID=UPI0029343E18|nr:gliding motility-associated ABC transporter ATP-binding subunit GldA [Polaribacter sp. HL-MS24]WOC39569.1 gliding motility-associated ABC transporter ATP-binding subunit GldA [Polaribacter sp. HL-MS24]
MSIKVTAVSKNYSSQKALDEVSFSAEKGQIIGFLGPNGAGKSTMMKILTGFVRPTSGAVFVDDIDVLQNPIAAQKNIGYLPEHNPLYAEMYVREYLHFQASLYKVGQREVENSIQKVGLESEAHKKINQLSKGFQQRVGLAAAIIHNPKVLILDEPTTGLDPNQLVEIRALIKALGKEKTVLFSTHIMQEVEAVCDRVIILQKGVILMDQTLLELHQNTKQLIEVTFDVQIEKSQFDQLKNKIFFENTHGNTWKIQFDSKNDMRSKIFDFAHENNFKILELNSQQKTLETLFREVTQSLHFHEN